MQENKTTVSSIGTKMQVAFLERKRLRLVTVDVHTLFLSQPNSKSIDNGHFVRLCSQITVMSNV